MADFKPAVPFNVPALILPMTYKKVNGVNVKSDFYSVKISVLDGVRIITVSKNGDISDKPLWIKTKYRAPAAQSWTDGVDREITGTWRTTYSTAGITYWVGIYANATATEPLCEVTASEGQVIDTAESNQIFVSAKSYGGTERVVDDKYVIADTMQIETWFQPDIKSQDRIKLLDDGSVWEILNTPEDIDRRHQYLRFKVQRIKGGA
ncbi:MAG: phage head closure protein [Bacteroidaceae bacterium]|nr:phage head closure protein [Bacteroidaceae bacterium]